VPSLTHEATLSVHVSAKTKTSRPKILKTQAESLEKISKDFAESSRNMQAYLKIKNKSAKLFFI
jgi:hypothetical protein